MPYFVRAILDIMNLIKISIFFISLNLIAKEFKVALIDSYFCPKKTYLKNSLSINFKNSFNQVISSCKEQLSGELHGHKVLIAATEKLPEGVKVSFDLYTVYDRKGTPSLEMWREAFHEINKIDYDLIASASSIAFNQKVNIDFPKTNKALYLSSPSSLIRKQSKFIWPHDSDLNMIFISDYRELSDTVKMAKGYQGHIELSQKSNLYFPSAVDYVDLRGSSLALGIFISRIIPLCVNTNRSNKSFVTTCIEKHKKEITLFNGNNVVNTFTLSN